MEDNKFGVILLPIIYIYIYIYIYTRRYQHEYDIKTKKQKNGTGDHMRENKKHIIDWNNRNFLEIDNGWRRRRLRKLSTLTASTHTWKST